jgi:hypothetical protein
MSRDHRCRVKSLWGSAQVRDKGVAAGGSGAPAAPELRRFRPRGFLAGAADAPGGPDGSGLGQGTLLPGGRLGLPGGALLPSASNHTSPQVYSSSLRGCQSRYRLHSLLPLLRKTIIHRCPIDTCDAYLLAIGWPDKDRLMPRKVFKLAVKFKRIISFDIKSENPRASRRVFPWELYESSRIVGYAPLRITTKSACHSHLLSFRSSKLHRHSSRSRIRHCQRYIHSFITYKILRINLIEIDVNLTNSYES